MPMLHAPLQLEVRLLVSAPLLLRVVMPHKYRVMLLMVVPMYVVQLPAAVLPVATLRAHPLQLPRACKPLVSALLHLRVRALHVIVV